MLESQSQVMDFHSLILISFQIIFQGFEKSLITDMIPKHMDHPASFIIRMSIEHILFIIIIKADQVYLLFLGLTKISLQFLLPQVVSFFSPVLVLSP